MKQFISRLLTLALIVTAVSGVQQVFAAAPNGTMTGTAQILTEGQNPAINAITVTDSGTEINDTDDIWIRIPTNTDVEWDSSDTTASISGLTTGVISTTVSYTQADGSSACGAGIDCKVLKLNVTTSFAAGEAATISDLAYQAGTTGSFADELDWSVDGGSNYGTGDASTGLSVADDSDPATSTTVGNQAPIITVTPSDGGSNGGTADGDPTDVGDDITFTVTASDVNSDDYFGIFCQTDDVTALGGTGNAPSCAGTEWAVSGATNTGVAISSTTYTTTGSESGCTSNEACAWFAFVCDDTTSSACFPADGSGDQGSALGTVTFADVPDDQALVTIDSIEYEFDTANDGLNGGGTEVDTSSSLDGAEAAAALVAVEGGSNATFYQRGAVVYVYADASGASGNSIGMTESADTGNDITLSGATLSGGDDDNDTPFVVNHAPSLTIGNVNVGDTTGGTGTIEPGDTIYWHIDSDDLADDDTVDAQDTVQMFVCSDGSTFVPTAGSDAGHCSGGSFICKSSAVNPTSTDAECNDSASLVPIPTAHGTTDVEVFLKDNHNMPYITAPGANSASSYTVQNVAPALGDTGLTTPGTIGSSGTIAAGGSATVTWTTRVYDTNGTDDIDSVDGEFFEDDAVNRGCSADDNNCYLDAVCEDQGDVTGSAPCNVSGACADYECEVTVYFNATDSANWEFATDGTDGGGTVNFAQTNGNSTINANTALDVVETTIAYGTVAIGGTSSGQTTAIANAGNQVFDVLIDGVDMNDGGSNDIQTEQQKWDQAGGSNFDWDANGEALIENATTGAASNGCANIDIAVRDGNTETTTNEDIYWKIRIPAAQAAASYTGTNTFATTASGNCTGTP